MPSPPTKAAVVVPALDTLGMHCKWRHDIHHNDSQHIDIQHNNKLNTALSIRTLNIMVKGFNSDCHLCFVSIILSITNKPNAFIVIMLNVIILNVNMLNVVMLNVVMLNVIMLNVVMLNVIMLNVIMLNVIMLNVIMLNVIMVNVYVWKSLPGTNTLAYYENS
jgi:hypothetical protein